MHILIINPNTSEDFTRKIQNIADRYAMPDTTVTSVNPKNGPNSIESIYDELLSSVPTIEAALSKIKDVDGIVIACYSDHPAVYALREITEVPVIGIAEASMHYACVLGHQFSIVTTNEEWEPLLWNAVKNYGLSTRCASVRSTRLPVLALETADAEEIYQIIKKMAVRAVEEDDAEVICLGCAGMSGLDKRLQQELEIPVLDGVVCALKMVEGLVGYGVAISKKRAYRKPGWKQVTGFSKALQSVYKE